jgi:hypothetical protein
VPARFHLFFALFLAGCAHIPSRDADPAPVAAVVLAPASNAQGEAQISDITLSGTVTFDDLATYKEIPFEAPVGAYSLSVRVDHDGREAHTILDLGLADPVGFRGWSGSNKSTLYASAFEATPSFRAGPVPGKWNLILGIPSVRRGVTTHWTATISFNARADAAGAIQLLSGAAPGWLRGDFHTHTGHSDGSCPSQSGARVPCPVGETLAAAVRSGLDFVSVTDHNTWAQNDALRELEPFYDRLTVVHGAEITTFKGHANALGVRYPVDFRLGTSHLPDTSILLDRIAAQGGILSLSHPGLASGELCMGCGWTGDIDYSRLTAIEAVNGGALRAGTVENPTTSGILFWQKLLDQGFHLTAIGGSDNHDATDMTGERQSPVGTPTTVVWTEDASEQAVIAGVKSGRVFIDLQNQRDRVLDMTAMTGAGSTVHAVAMGGTLHLAPGSQAALLITLDGAPEAAIELVAHNLDVVQGADPHTAQITLASGAANGWIRANARDTAGKLILLGNPIYVTR